MPSIVPRYGLLGVRLVLVGGGLGLAVVAGHALATVPPATPDGDGFVTAGAYLLWGALSVLSLGVAGVGVALPAVLGSETTASVGFDGRQRRLLRAAGLTLLASAVVGATGVGANSFVGILLALGVAVLGVLGVCFALTWRLGGVVLRRLGRGRAEDGG